MTRQPYPSDVSDEERAFVAPSLTFMTEDAPQRDHALRPPRPPCGGGERGGRAPAPRAVIVDARTMQSPPLPPRRGGKGGARSMWLKRFITFMLEST